jgi:hypothetical protein
MRDLSYYSFKGLLLPDNIRKKTSFFSELWSLFVQKLMPHSFDDSDVRSLLIKKEHREELWNSITCIDGQCNNEKGVFLKSIKNDAVEAFNEIASIINGEQQNLYIKERLDRLKLDSVFVSGRPESKEQIEKIILQLNKIEKNVIVVRKSFKSCGTNIQLSYRLEKLHNDIEQAYDILRICSQDCEIKEIQKILEKLIQQRTDHNSIRHYIKSKSKVLTKTIVEHNTTSGDKYIAASKKEYYKIFKASVIGGFLLRFSPFLK